MSRSYIGECGGRTRRHGGHLDLSGVTHPRGDLQVAQGSVER